MKIKKATGKNEKQVKTEENTDNVAAKNQGSADTSDGTAAIEEKSGPVDPQHKILELNDKLLRLYSEFDNYRKRTIKEKIEMSKTASEDLITDLLPVMDDFERAIKSFETAQSMDAMMEGVQLIYAKFKNVLSAKGLQELPSLGEPFDTDHQEAIAHIPAPTEDLKNKVVDELQKGYKLNDKVIRFAKVVVGS
ncbi:MAG: nucleotide exchange factor GrpE [Bacteroidetes bacterium]|nr:nucleotide exchange factor GrpE [Bacteroidota bacterium]